MLRKISISFIIVTIILNMIMPIFIFAENSDSATYDNIIYKVLDEDQKTAMVRGSTDKEILQANIRKSVSINGGSYTVTEIASLAFDSCTKLNAVTLPEGIIAIREFAFSHCENLTQINIPESTKQIGSYAFSNCKKLKNITLPDSLEILGGSAFQYCESIEKIKIPAGISEVKRKFIL